MTKGSRVRAVRKNAPEATQKAVYEENEDSTKADEQVSSEGPEVLSADEAEHQQTQNKGFERPQFQIGGSDAQEVVTNLKEKVTYWLDRGRYSKVRIKRNGKQLGPDIPVAALLALEAATFFGTGILRGALMHAVGRVFFEVELINEAEEIHTEGVSLFLGGDLEAAKSHFEKAIAVDGRFAPAHLQMGVLCKVQNDLEQARRFFEKAYELDPEGQTGEEAQAHIAKMEDVS